MLKTTLLLAAMVLSGCGGLALNDRGADWCVADERLLDAASAAVTEWNDAGTHMALHLSSDCDGADVSMRVGDPGGSNNGKLSSDGELVVSPKALEPELLRLTILHELGHYLTGGAHSANDADVMAATDAGGTEGRHLTEADKARLDGVFVW